MTCTFISKYQAGDPTENSGSVLLREMRPIGILNSLVIGFLLLCIGYTPAIAGGGSLVPTGTFSSMYYSEEGGDLLGIDLKIVSTSNGYMGVIQFGEGEGGELMLIEPVIDNGTIAFSYDNNGEQAVFKGVFTEYGIQPLNQDAYYWWNLRRQPSFWDEYRNDYIPPHGQPHQKQDGEASKAQGFSRSESFDQNRATLHEAGFAVDVGNWNRETGRPHGLSAAQWAKVISNAKEAGLSWGGHFKKGRDDIHFYSEVPGGRPNRSNWAAAAQGNATSWSVD